MAVIWSSKEVTQRFMALKTAIIWTYEEINYNN